MEFREFRDEDAEFCFKVRAAAFIKEFYGEIGPDIVTACVNEYMPEDYVRMTKQMKIFVVWDDDSRIGFVTVKVFDDKRAEIPLVYFDLNKIGKGYGTKALVFVENWLSENQSDVKEIFLDTIIPEYNGGFYLKKGLGKVSTSYCSFGELKVPAVRFVKELEVA